MAPITPALAGPPEPEPYLVKDIYPGKEGSDPTQLTAVNNRVFFAAYDETHGDELWRSDGTAAGTVLVRDIYPDGFSSHPACLTHANGRLFFSANDGIHGNELWRSDGTQAGTMLVKDIYPGSGGSVYNHCMNWAVVHSTLFFVADDGIHGEELWRSDGTPAGTTLVKDIYPGTYDAYPNNLTAVKDRLFFSATNGIAGYELWQSDGTQAGTTLVKDIASGTLNSVAWYSSQSWTAVGDTLFFIATDGACGFELWRSDGTAVGTTLVKDINPGCDGSFPQSLTQVNGRLYFRATSAPYGAELWQSDGSEAGTVLVRDIYPGSYGSNPRELTNVNGKLFFAATNSDHSYSSKVQRAGIPNAPYGLELWSLNYFTYLPMGYR